MSRMDACSCNPQDSGSLVIFFDLSKDTVAKLNGQLTRGRLSNMQWHVSWALKSLSPTKCNIACLNALWAWLLCERSSTHDLQRECTVSDWCLALAAYFAMYHAQACTSTINWRSTLALHCCSCRRLWELTRGSFLLVVSVARILLSESFSNYKVEHVCSGRGWSMLLFFLGVFSILHTNSMWSPPKTSTFSGRAL